MSDVDREVAATVRDVELADGIPGLPARGRTTGDSAWLLVRAFTEPLGLIERELQAAPIRPEQVLQLLIEALGPSLTQRLAEIGLSLEHLTTDGLGRTSSPFTEGRVRALRQAEECSVVICTRDRPRGLMRTLESLTAQTHAPTQVIIVDNTPTSSAGQEVARAYAERLDLQYVVEPRPGLSRARNRALEIVRSPLIAWLDDDTSADRWWLAEVVRAFVEEPDIAALSGLVVPLALETTDQVLFERFGGHSKGRGFSPDVFSRATAARQSPLYPLPPFGVGANMAFRTPDLLALGGFDEALGAGTRTRAGEDTLVFTRLLLRGRSMAYRPSAIVRHLHRSDRAALAAQLEGYGTGLTAFYTAMVLQRPSTVWQLLRLVPRAVRDLFGGDSPRVATTGKDFPAELLASNRRAMLSGPFLYVSERRRARLPLLPRTKG
ncbi:GT2 family glycosyltransferase [Geodermatophilus bullaregiensis]|uniref:glycosyltransferase family 2 protein n=1 Tax=Geodermatophilus bullaregiensis TaxID=1564160 RepID=UPI0019586C84|nr:GT2 family glycosyltransferase [Geodermatophilus bullaregiensis]